MSDFSGCFDVQAPCLSEDGASCASFFHADALTHVLATVSYNCDTADLEVSVEWEIKADGFFTPEDEFAALSLSSEATVMQPGETALFSADLSGLLRAGIHVDVTCFVLVAGERVDGASNSNKNLEIVE